jgi:hypothetical protein
MQRPQRTVPSSGHACARLKNWRLAALLVLDAREIRSYTGHPWTPILRSCSAVAALSVRLVVRIWTLTARLAALSAVSASTLQLALQPA